MKNSTMDTNDIKKISKYLTAENKEYAIAVDRALLFAQTNDSQPQKPPKNKLA